MEGAIASCHWDACDTCKNFSDNELACGCCKIPGTQDVEIDPYTDSIVCTEYEVRV